MPTVLDQLHMTPDERQRADQQRKAQARADLFAMANDRNRLTGQDSVIMQRAAATADAAQLEEEQRQAARAQEAERQFRNEIRRVYLESGGSAEGFERDWPELRAEIVRRETLAAASGIDPKQPTDTGATKYLRAHYRR